MRTIKNTIGIALLGSLLLVALGLLYVEGVRLAHAGQTSDQTTLSNVYRTYEFFASTTAATVLATSTTATSSNITGSFDSSGILNNGIMDIRGAKKVSVNFTRGGAFAAANTGTSTFAVQYSPDGTNWYYFNRLLTSTTTQTSTFGGATGVYGSDPTLGSQVKIGATAPGNVATTSQAYSLDLSSISAAFIRCIVVTQVDGAAQCQGSATF